MLLKFKISWWRNISDFNRLIRLLDYLEDSSEAIELFATVGNSIFGLSRNICHKAYSPHFRMAVANHPRQNFNCQCGEKSQQVNRIVAKIPVANIPCGENSYGEQSCGEQECGETSGYRKNQSRSALYPLRLSCLEITVCPNIRFVCILVYLL